MPLTSADLDRLVARLPHRVRRHAVAVLRAHAEPVIRGILDDRRHAAVLIRADLAAARPTLRALEHTVDAVAPVFDRRPLGPDLPIHAAHARDPRVREVFARHGLPNCPACPVGADETLAEAAFSEGFDVDQLLAELVALGIGDRSPQPSPAPSVR